MGMTVNESPHDEVNHNSPLAYATCPRRRLDSVFPLRKGTSRVSDAKTRMVKSPRPNASHSYLLGLAPGLIRFSRFGAFRLGDCDASRAGDLKITLLHMYQVLVATAPRNPSSP